MCFFDKSKRACGPSHVLKVGEDDWFDFLLEAWCHSVCLFVKNRTRVAPVTCYTYDKLIGSHLR